MKISFSGHRPDKLPNKETGYKIPNPTYDFVVKSLREVLLKLKPEIAISGMALGVDSWAAEICLELGIPFIAAIPFIGQEKVWPQSSKDQYNFLLSKASEKVIVNPGGYAAWKMQARNQWMSDQADQIIAVWDGSDGGTGNCVKYVKKINKPLIIIDPIKKEIFY